MIYQAEMRGIRVGRSIVGFDEAIFKALVDVNQSCYYCHHEESGHAWPVKPSFELKKYNEVYIPGDGYGIVEAL